MPSRFNEGICGVCGRREVGLGFSQRNGRRDLPTMWLCDDPTCAKIARETYSMKQDQFDRIESLAAQRGGDEGGQYLESIGRTNLETLTIDEWCEFCRRVVAGYRKALINDLRNEAPF